jgi:hypothetical protein
MKTQPKNFPLTQTSAAEYREEIAVLKTLLCEWEDKYQRLLEQFKLSQHSCLMKLKRFWNLNQRVSSRLILAKSLKAVLNYRQTYPENMLLMLFLMQIRSVIVVVIRCIKWVRKSAKN